MKNECRPPGYPRRTLILLAAVALMGYGAPKANGLDRAMTVVPTAFDGDTLPAKTRKKMTAQAPADLRLEIADSLVSIRQFPPDMDSGLYETPKKYLRDLGGDGQQELIIQYYSGGAHCCQVTDIFTPTHPKTYRRIFEFWGDLKFSPPGMVCNFYESVGYFFTYYACSVDDSIPSSHFAATIRFRYDRGKFGLAPHSATVDASIRKDLLFLRNRGVPPTDSTEANFDDGTRKSYAERIVAYYFNNDMNLELSRKLFGDYYLYADSDAVWKEIVSDIESIKSLNTW